MRDTPAAPEKVTVYIDGACEPRNPGGIACYGYVIYRGEELVASGYGVHSRGAGATNNVAEHAAAIAALTRLLELGLHRARVELRSDIQLLVCQVRGIYAVRSAQLRALYRQLHSLASRFPFLRWEWVPREANREADALSRRAYEEAALQERARQLAVESLPDGSYRVRSSTGERWYAVSLVPEERCECPAYLRGMRPCKHIVAAKAAASGVGDAG